MSAEINLVIRYVFTITVTLHITITPKTRFSDFRFPEQH